MAYLSDTTDALSAYQQASELDPSNPDAWNQLGHLYKRVGELGKSIDAYETILTLPEGTSNEWQAIVYGNLGIVYQTRGELDRAVEMFEKSLAINDHWVDRKVWQTSTAIWATSTERGANWIVLSRCLRNHWPSKALGRQDGMASVYGNLGNVYRTRGELDRAVEMFEKSLAINEALGRQDGMANQYGNLGNVYRTRGRTGSCCRDV